MRKVLSLVCFLCMLALGSKAQYSPLLHQQDGYCTFALNSLIHTGSNTLTTKNYLLMRNGGHLDGSAIESISDRLQDRNLLGGLYDMEYTGLHQRRMVPGKDSMFYIVRAGYHQLQEATFSRNAAMLALYGNQRFEGDTLALGPFVYNHLSWYQVKAGVMKRSRNGSNKFYAGVALGLNIGLNHMSIHVPEASLYTAPHGEWLSFHSRMSFSRSSGTGSALGGAQGVGPGIDLFFAWIREQGPSVSVSLTQLGFITWNSPGYRWQRDSVIRFEGVIIDNIFAGGDLWGDGITADTLDKLFVSYGQPARHTMAMPATFLVEYRQPIKDFPLTLRGNFMYRTESIMRPRLEVYLDWQPSPRLILTRSHTLGGYGGYGTGFGAATRIGKELWIHLSATDFYRIFAGGSEVNLFLRAGLIYRAGQNQLAP